MSLDGTDFPIENKGGFNPEYYSHKFHGTGLRYEVGISIVSGLIAWVGGGFPCGAWSDLRVARESFIHQLDPGERVIADRGYTDDIYFVTENTHPQLSREIKLILARHETVNGRLKSFNILKQKYRHSIESHFQCFYVVATLVQLNLRSEPLFKLYI